MASVMDDFDKWAAANGVTNISPVNSDVKFSDHPLDYLANQFQNPKSGTSAAIQGAGEGISLGTAKYLGAAVSKLVNGGTYSENLSSVIDKQKQAEETHPVIYGASDVAGSLLPYGAIASPNLFKNIGSGVVKTSEILNRVPTGFESTGTLADIGRSLWRKPGLSQISSGGVVGVISGASQYQPEGYTLPGIVTNAAEGAGAGAMAGAMGQGLSSLSGFTSKHMGLYTEDAAIKDALLTNVKDSARYGNGMSAADTRAIIRGIENSKSGKEAVSNYGEYYTPLADSNGLAIPSSNIEQDAYRKIIDNGVAQKYAPNGLVPAIGKIAIGSGIGAGVGYGANSLGINQMGDIPVNPATAAAAFGLEQGIRPAVKIGVDYIKGIAQKSLNNTIASTTSNSISAFNESAAADNAFWRHYAILYGPNDTPHFPPIPLMENPFTSSYNSEGIGSGGAVYTIYQGLKKTPIGLIPSTTNQIGQSLGIVQPVGQSLRDMSNSLFTNGNNSGNIQNNQDFDSWAKANGVTYSN